MFPCEIPRNADLYVSSAFVLLAARKQTPQLFRKKNVVSHQSPRASEEPGAQNHQQILQSQHRVTPSFHFPERCGEAVTAFSAAQLGPGKPGSTGFRSNERSAPGVHPDDFGRGAPVGLAEQRAYAPNPWLVQRSET